ncbi:MAG: BamA/TamA family outer membrane protein [Bacteroidota bacterium]
MRLRYSAALLVALVFLAGCATTARYVRGDATPPLPSVELAHTVFLVGNTADARPEVMRALRADALATGKESAVVFLGDLTPRGMDEDALEAESVIAPEPLQRLVDAVAGYEGEVYAVPGDRDWANGPDGVRALGQALDQLLGREEVLLPGDALGGVREFELTDGLRLFAIDTAWWLQNDEDRPAGELEDFDVATPADLTIALQALIADRDDDQILVVGHHPIRSVGENAGYRTFGETLSSFGLVPVLRQSFGLSRQDLAAPTYRAMRNALDGVFSGRGATDSKLTNGLVYAASHDRSLQVIEAERSPVTKQTYLVSGAAGETQPTVGGRGAEYAHAIPGYMRVRFYDDGRTWVEVVEMENGVPMVAYRQEVAGVNQERLDPEVPVDPSDLPDTSQPVTMAAQDDFATGPFRNDGITRLSFGAGYRDAWATPFTIEVLDLGTEAGGLTPVKRGGGLQTTSLRLQGEDGYQYGLRLLEKSGLAQVPPELRGGLVGDIVRDQRAAANPFGVLVAAGLADALDVLYQQPRLVYVPDDPRLGRYRETFADRLALFEIRADDDVSEVPGLLGAADVVSAQKLREEMAEDQDHQVDQRNYLRARLLDAMLGDWDRHADQWRWNAYEPVELDPSLTGDAATQGKIYRPIPRDRDFAFYRPGGIMGFFLAYFDDRFEPYNPDFTDTYGLTFNGFKQDRRFFSALSREDFEAVAREMQRELPDIVIERAVARVPREIRRVEGAFWAESLKGRRDDLVTFADRLYRLHADVVDIVGSDERELVEAVHQPGGHLEVTMYSYKRSERGRELYRRTFSPRETDEVRLYTFAARDRVIVRGDGPIRVRLIGGGGEDELQSESGNVFAYDTPDGLSIEGRARDRRSSDPEVNSYDPDAYKPTDVDMAPFVGANPTDGLILGATRTYTVSGFRLEPAAATHMVFANIATGTGGIQVGYTGRMLDALRSFDLDVDAVASTPRYVRNFYGLGNETDLIAQDLARVQLAQVRGEVLLGGALSQSLRLRVGPSARYVDVQRDTVESAGAPVLMLPVSTFDAQLHAGGAARLTLDLTDSRINPRQGIELDVHAATFAGLTGDAGNYSRLGGDVQAFVPFSLFPQLTLALRAGADHRIGDFPFFDGATLGGATNLRGVRRERFTGQTAAFGNAEARVKLFDFRTYVLPIEVGALGFGDAGRVWDVGESAGVFDDLHLGVGGGLWFNVLDMAVVNVTVARSDEETLVTFGGGFQY